MARTVPLVITVLLLAAAFTTPGAAAAPPPPSSIVTGLEEGWPEVLGFDRFGSRSRTWTQEGDQWPFHWSVYPTYRNGVRVAVGDLVGDGALEILTAPGSDNWSDINVFDGRTFERVHSFPALPFLNYWAGAFVAAGDVGGDAKSEAVIGLDRGCCTSVGVWDARSASRVSAFFPFEPSSFVGAHVATGDLGGDAKSEILAAPVGSPWVSAFPGTGGPAFRMLAPFGNDVVVAVAAGDLAGDARAEVVAGASTAEGLRVRVLDAVTGATLSLLAPFGSTVATDLSLAVADVDGNGAGDVVAAARTSGGTSIAAVSAEGIPIASFFVTDPSVAPGATVASGDLDGDGKAEIVVGSGPTGAPAPPYSGPDQRVAVFDRTGRELASFAAYRGIFQGGVRVAEGDVAGDANPEVVTAPGPGMEAEIHVYTHEWRSDRDRGSRLSHFLAFESSFQGGASVATGQLDADRNVEIAVGSGPGRPAEVRIFDATGNRIRSFMPFEPSFTGGVQVATGDRNADGAAELAVSAETGPARVRILSAEGIPLQTIQPAGYETGARVALADLAGDGRSTLVLAPRAGVAPWLTVLSASGEQLARFKGYDESFLGGLHVAAGDLDDDGRDELVVTPGAGGQTDVRIFRVVAPPESTDYAVRQIRAFAPYQWRWPGLEVAVRTRVGPPLATSPRTVRLRVRSRASFIVAVFRDALGPRDAVGSFVAYVDWPSGARTRATITNPENSGLYQVRVARRFTRAGRYPATVTIKDDRGRLAIARSVVVVSRARR